MEKVKEVEKDVSARVAVSRNCTRVGKVARMVDQCWKPGMSISAEASAARLPFPLRKMLLAGHESEKEKLSDELWAPAPTGILRSTCRCCWCCSG